MFGFFSLALESGVQIYIEHRYTFDWSSHTLSKKINQATGGPILLETHSNKGSKERKSGKCVRCKSLHKNRPEIMAYRAHSRQALLFGRKCISWQYMENKSCSFFFFF